MKISMIVSRVFRATKRGALIALAALVLTSATVPPSAFAHGATAQLMGPDDGTGDNPQMP